MQPRDLEIILFERLKIIHQSALGGGAAHVERQQRGKVERATVKGRHQRARRRPGF